MASKDMSSYWKNNFFHRIFLPYFDVRKFSISIKNTPRYLVNLIKYMRRSKQNLLSYNLYPILNESTPTTGVDYHYLYQQIWVFQEVFKRKPKSHLDIGSTYQMSCYLASITKATFLDIRPITVQIKNLKALSGDIVNLPLKDNSIESLSCLHVIEHIGLARYGDQLDVNGSERACRELARVLKPGGYLYLSTPIGKETICFNAHRIFNPHSIKNYFGNLELEDFSVVDDSGLLLKNVKLSSYENLGYGLGMFLFKKTK